MAFGIEGSPTRGPVFPLICAALLLAVAGSACAQGTPAPVTVPTFSASCDAPFRDIANPMPLPHLTAALEAKRPIKVMAVGSSSTVGVGATTPARSYPNQLSGILLKSFDGLNIKVINRGVSGELAAATADRMRTMAAMERPTLILWQVGTNDALSRVPVDEFAETVRENLRWLKERNIDVVLVGLQYTSKANQDEHYMAIRDRLAQVAAEEAVLLVRRFAAMQFLEKAKGEPTLVADDLHHNDLGYRCMAEHIARAMVVSSFLKRKDREAVMTQ